MTLALFLEQNVWLAVVVLLAQIANQTVAALLACTIPLVLRHLGQDPTLGTSTLITAASDITGFATFLGLASLLL